MKTILNLTKVEVIDAIERYLAEEKGQTRPTKRLDVVTTARPHSENAEGLVNDSFYLQVVID